MICLIHWICECYVVYCGRSFGVFFSQKLEGEIFEVKAGRKMKNVIQITCLLNIVCEKKCFLQSILLSCQLTGQLCIFCFAFLCPANDHNNYAGVLKALNLVKGTNLKCVETVHNQDFLYWWGSGVL